MRAEFECLIVLKDECFTKGGRLRRNKPMRKGIADSLKFEAHRFIDNKTTEEIIQKASLELEDVEVEE